MKEGTETAAAQAGAEVAAAQAGAGTELQDAGTPATTPAQRPPESPWAGFMMPLLLIALFYFMFLRPQQRKEKERRKMIDDLRAGAKVVFAGGIIGKIVEADTQTFLVETEGGTQMRVLRSAVQSLAEAPAAK